MRSSAMFRVNGGIGAAMAVAVTAASFLAASPVAARPAVGRAVPALLPMSDVLTSVAAASAGSAWAVGSYANRRTGLRQALAERWNGHSWSIVPTPVVGHSNVLVGAAAGRRATWAVGYYSPNSGPTRTLIERWTGTAWKRVSSPSVTGEPSQLSSVTIVSRTSAWAVGEVFNGAANQTLIEHWNGTSWKVVTSPSVAGRSNFLNAVVTVAPGGAWTVGNSVSGGNGQTLAEQWTGSAWQQTTTQDFGTSSNFYGVAALSATDVYAVGDDISGSEQTLIEKWDGGTWSKVASPNGPSASASFLFAAGAAPSAGKAWAVGGYFVGPVETTLVERLTGGGTWQRVASPNASTTFNTLTSVAVTSATNAWAIGTYRKGTTVFTLIEHWNGHAWKRVPSPSR